jgi:hypothetical protein
MFLRIHPTKHIHAPRTNDRRNSPSTRKVMTHVSIQNCGKNLLGQSDLSTLVSNKKLDGWRTHPRVYRAYLNRLAYFSYVASSSCARRIDKKWKKRNKHQPNNEQGINSKCKITHLYNCIRYQRRRSLRVHN